MKKMSNNSNVFLTFEEDLFHLNVKSCYKNSDWLRNRVLIFSERDGSSLKISNQLCYNFQQLQRVTFSNVRNTTAT